LFATTVETSEAVDEIDATIVETITDVEYNISSFSSMFQQLLHCTSFSSYYI
ncbi:hypothetical protein HAX54_016308, partial [Datura stramonium]|nr:hypothetical protein [Datura stramonium]